jgi:hypothetical protein
VGGWGRLRWRQGRERRWEETEKTAERMTEAKEWEGRKGRGEETEKIPKRMRERGREGETEIEIGEGKKVREGWLRQRRWQFGCGEVRGVKEGREGRNREEGGERGGDNEETGGRLTETEIEMGREGWWDATDDNMAERMGERGKDGKGGKREEKQEKTEKRGWWGRLRWG